MRALFSILTMFLAFTVTSQVQSFVRTYGGQGFHEGRRLLVLKDSTYLLMGNISGFSQMNNVYLIHTNKTGQIIRDRVFGDNFLYYGSDLAMVNDSLYVVTGYTLNQESAEYDIFIMWINSDLDLVKKEQFSAPSWDLGKAVVADSSGNVYVAGTTYSYGPKPAIILLQYDHEGIYSGLKIIQQPEAEFYAESMIIAFDSILFISGSSKTETGPSEGMILKTDTYFNQVDTLFYKVDSLNIFYNDIALIGNDRVSVTGYFTNTNDNIKKLFYHSYNTDLLMNGAIWDYLNDSYCNCIASSVFNETALGCYTSYYGAGNGDFWFFRFQFNAYLGSTTAGGNMRDEMYDIAYALDSSLVMIGTTQSYGQNASSIMFAKTCKEYYFCVQDYQHITDIRKPEIHRNANIFPNPTEGNIYVQLPDKMLKGDIQAIVFSPTGQIMDTEMTTTSENVIQINTSRLNKGIYYILIQTHSSTYRGSFIKF